ncbi:hypothetical protein M3685_11010 [Heyndrickxia oleronia]|uniref:hypothetical protein n=1 Tax=Heyndrickxia oleronia TaxID=38875 RepID=UPI002040D444|nr:hypothetical protein [Heyndrickxia oleronia]MCM3454474.1 hypothetical protein [Heyndrickxia oleronia]
MVKYMPYLEWEGLQDNYEIRNISAPNNIALDQITVSRDDEYNINASLKGVNLSDNLFEQFHGESEAGQRVKSFELYGLGKADMNLYTLKDCHLGNISSNYKEINEDTYINEFVAELYTFEVEKKRNDSINDVSSLTEWFINGPAQSFLYPRSTKREYTERYILNRGVYPKQIIENEFTSNQSGFDYLLVDLKNFKFIIHNVPKDIGPTWSNNIGIEYSEEYGGIPDPDIREAISEIVSFIFGRHLLKVGLTEFDENNLPLKQTSYNPWGNNVVSKCKRHSLYPVRLNNDKVWGKVEVLLNEIIPKYLKHRNELNLKDALWSYWVSEDVPTGTNIPILANALEILKKGWFKSTKSKTQGVYMPKKEFDELLKETYNTLEELLKGHEYADRIIRRIKGSFNMGVNESLDFFFHEIGLPIGKIEKKAIKARNSIIHDKHVETDKELEEIIFYSKVYKTLFHRVFLKLLSYEGDYIDYSIIGYPNKHIDMVTSYE